MHEPSEDVNGYVRRVRTEFALLRFLFFNTVTDIFELVPLALALDRFIIVRFDTPCIRYDTITMTYDTGLPKPAETRAGVPPLPANHKATPAKKLEIISLSLQ